MMYNSENTSTNAGISRPIIDAIALAGIKKTVDASTASVIYVKYTNVSPADTNKTVVQINIDKTTGNIPLMEYA